MRRLLIIAAVLTPLLATVAPAPAKAQDVGFSIRIGDRYRGSSLYFRNSPRMYVVPGTRVYYVRDENGIVVLRLHHHARRPLTR